MEPLTKKTSELGRYDKYVQCRVTMVDYFFSGLYISCLLLQVLSSLNNIAMHPHFMIYYCVTPIRFLPVRSRLGRSERKEPRLHRLSPSPPRPATTLRPFWNWDKSGYYPTDLLTGSPSLSRSLP